MSPGDTKRKNPSQGPPAPTDAEPNPSTGVNGEQNTEGGPVTRYFDPLVVEKEREKFVRGYLERPIHLVERDFGYMWTSRGGFPNYRVSWVQSTGEIYAFNCSTRCTETLGHLTRSQLDQVMQKWPEIMHRPNSLDILRRAVKDA